MKDRIQIQDLNSLTFSLELSEAGTEYREIIAARSEDTELRPLLEAVSSLGAVSLLPAIMSAYDEEDRDGRIRFISALVTSFVRHNVIGNLENSKLETVAFNLARELRETHNFDAGIGRLREFVPSNDDFVEKFRTAQVSRMKTARYMLEKLEYAMRRTEEINVAGPERVHVEHVYPKNPSGERWEIHASVIDRHSAI